MIHIRQSTPEDGLAAIDIWRHAVHKTHEFLRPEDRDELDAELSAYLPRAPMWIAADEEHRPCAFMLLSDGRMDALFVHPDHHGRGLGTTLVKHALTMYPHLETDVNEQNTSACKFYRKMQFEVVGRSERDGQGRPYPLLHLRYKGAG